MLLSNNLHIFEHVRIGAQTDFLAARRRHIPQNDLLRLDVWILLDVFRACVFSVEIAENYRTIVVVRMVRIFDLDIFEQNLARHVALIAEIMLS